MKYEVAGIVTGKRPRKFMKNVEAVSEKLAREKALCLLGSNMGVPRSKIKISGVKKVSA